MILKNENYFWKIDFDPDVTTWPFRLSDEADFINIFLTFDMQNKITKDNGILYRTMFYDSI